MENVRVCVHVCVHFVDAAANCSLVYTGKCPLRVHLAAHVINSAGQIVLWIVRQQRSQIRMILLLQCLPLPHCNCPLCCYWLHINSIWGLKSKTCTDLNKKLCQQSNQHSWPACTLPAGSNSQQAWGVFYSLGRGSALAGNMGFVHLKCQRNTHTGFEEGQNTKQHYRVQLNW